MQRSTKYQDTDDFLGRKPGNPNQRFETLPGIQAEVAGSAITNGEGSKSLSVPAFSLHDIVPSMTLTSYSK